MQYLNEWLYSLLTRWGVPGEGATWLTALCLFTAAMLLAWILAWTAGRISNSVFSRLARRTASALDDFLLRNKVVLLLSRIIPFVFIYRSLPGIFYHLPDWLSAAIILADVYFILWVVWLIRAFLRSVRDYLKTREAYRDKPVDSFVQVIVIFAYLVAGIVIFSTVTGKSAGALLATMGAASAILLLIFKDSILGFVASIQISANDMVRIGDWITMDKYGADGDVVEINLATVKVQNFDKTITTIPTYYLISDSFKNWRGMQNAGGRRIKRAVRIKVSSIRFLAEEDIDRLSRIALISGYLHNIRREIAGHNEHLEADTTFPVNGRRLTNIGVYRHYVENYLKDLRHTHKGMTIMTRQLEPSIHGIPIELYVFINDTRWVNYEHIMADIFDHILAVVPYFGLEVYEQPNSGDMRYLADALPGAGAPEARQSYR